MSGLQDLRSVVADAHLDGDVLSRHRSSFEGRAGHFVHLQDFLRPEVADQLSRFLLEQAEFYTEHGLVGADGPVAERAWLDADEADRFFRLGKLLRTREGCSLTAESMRYVRFRHQLQEPAFREYFEAITGLPLRSTDDFGVHSMGHGDFLASHSDAKGERQLALVLYLTPDWSEADGGVLQIIDPHGVTRSVVPTYNSLVAFDVRAGTQHLVTPIVRIDGGAPRVTIGGWYDGRADDSP